MAMAIMVSEWMNEAARKDQKKSKSVIFTSKFWVVVKFWNLDSEFIVQMFKLANKIFLKYSKYKILFQKLPKMFKITQFNVAILRSIFSYIMWIFNAETIFVIIIASKHIVGIFGNRNKRTCIYF